MKKYMKKLFIPGFFILMLTVSEAQTQNKMESLLVSDLKFRSTLGFKPADRENVFTVLGNGFYGTPKSENSDSLIRAWIKSHPKASVVPVTMLGSAKVADANSNMIYCWIIDAGDTLNNHLIRNGCFPGAAMTTPSTWEEMTAEEKKKRKADMEPPVNVYVRQSDYDKFLQQIFSAEKFAKENDLGIWDENGK
jgi:hypothetical protein